MDSYNTSAGFPTPTGWRSRVDVSCFIQQFIFMKTGKQSRSAPMCPDETQREQQRTCREHAESPGEPLYHSWPQVNENNAVKWWAD